MVRIWLDEVLYVESLKEYVRFSLPDDKSVVTKMPLGELERIFESAGFLRVHRSYLVALRHIEAYSNTAVQVGGKEIPIGRQYREEVLHMISGLSAL